MAEVFFFIFVAVGIPTLGVSNAQSLEFATFNLVVAEKHKGLQGP